MPLGALITKENGWIYVNSIVVYLFLFTFPHEITSSSIFVIVTVCVTVLTGRVAGIEKLHQRVFRRQLAKSEIKIRRTVPEHDYDEIRQKGQDEVDKIDEYFHHHAKVFSGLLIITVIQGILIISQGIDVIPESSFVVQQYTVSSVHLAIFAVTVNGILMYDSFHEIRRYMFEDLIEVYDKHN